MANEIQLQFQARLNNGSLSDTYSASIQVSQTTARMVRNVQQIGTSEEALETGDIVTPGFSVFINLDATNYVEIGSFIGGTFYPFIKLKAGEQSGPVRLGISAATLYAKANMANVELFYIIYDD